MLAKPLALASVGVEVAAGFDALSWSLTQGGVRVLMRMLVRGGPQDRPEEAGTMQTPPQENGGRREEHGAQKHGWGV